MSNAFAAALWAGDYMLLLASLGCVGVNLHGGSSAFLTAGLGGHTPGMDVAKTPQAMRSGFYTPIFTEPGAAVKAMPIFYGMMLANQFAGGTMMQVEREIRRRERDGLCGPDKSGYKVAMFNKDESKAVDVSLRMPGKAHKATAWRLQAPALDSTEGVTLAGAEIAAHGVWSAKQDRASRGEERSRADPYSGRQRGAGVREVKWTIPGAQGRGPGAPVRGAETLFAQRELAGGLEQLGHGFLRARLGVDAHAAARCRWRGAAARFRRRWAWFWLRDCRGRTSRRPDFPGAGWACRRRRDRRA